MLLGSVYSLPGCTTEICTGSTGDTGDTEGCEGYLSNLPVICRQVTINHLDRRICHWFDPKRKRAGLDRSSVFGKICVLLPPFEHNLTNPLHGNIEQPRQVANALAFRIPHPDFLVASRFRRCVVRARSGCKHLTKVHEDHAVTNGVL
jgi:hypothetical protein